MYSQLILSRICDSLLKLSRTCKGVLNVVCATEIADISLSAMPATVHVDECSSLRYLLHGISSTM